MVLAGRFSVGLVIRSNARHKHIPSNPLNDTVMSAIENCVALRYGPGAQGFVPAIAFNPHLRA